ncbi:MAG: VOC family protein [Anaerolineae bacterium]|nr:VOC family protein [Anaerolineae bacterium]
MHPILEMRVALTAQDYESLVNFYQNALGLDPADIWTSDGQQGVIYDLGRATLEVLAEGTAAKVDQLEVGRRVSGQVRFALEVPDVDAALQRALAHGAVLEHEPVVTPWNHRNARLRSPDGLQITLFQVLGE